MTQPEEPEDPALERYDKHDDPMAALGYPEGLPTAQGPSEAVFSFGKSRAFFIDLAARIEALPTDAEKQALWEAETTSKMRCGCGHLWDQHDHEGCEVCGNDCHSN